MALAALESNLDCSGMLWLPGKHQVYPGVSQAKRAFPDDVDLHCIGLNCSGESYTVLVSTVQTNS